MAATDSALLDRTSFGSLRPYAIVFCSAASSVGAISLAIQSNGVNEIGWRTAVQYSGRVAVLLFLLPFLIGPIARLFRAPTLLIDRRAYGVGFAAAFALYLATVMAPFVVAHVAIPPTVLATSAVGIILLAVQVITSNAWSIRKLGFLTWSKLHTFAMYAYWTAFSIGFLDRVVGPSRPDSFMQVGLCLMIGALLIRFAASFATKIGLAPAANR